mgnify:FL=1
MAGAVWQNAEKAGDHDGLPAFMDRVTAAGTAASLLMDQNRF